MAYYAFIDNNKIVVNVITGVDEDVVQTDLDGTEVGGSTESWEAFYSNQPQFAGLRCVRTSYNTQNNSHKNGGVPFRGNYAGIGYTYDDDFNIFIPPRPYPSWIIDYTIANWKAPVPMPEEIEDHVWKWSETNQEWISVPIQ